MNRYRFLMNALLSLSVFLFGALVLSAQQAQPTNGVPAHMVVTVEAHHGNDVPVIHREDVMVYEGKERDTVTDWIPAEGEHAALELIILLDDSSGMDLGSQLDDIKKFIEGQPDSTKIGVAYMQDGTARMAQNLTSDHAQAVKALRLPLSSPGINASPYFSVSDLVKRWPESTARREVVMVSDGIDRYYGTGDLSDPYVDAAVSDAQKAGIVVSAIYSPGAGHFAHSHWQSYWGQMYLAQLAEKTGGEAYYIGMSGAPVAFAPYLDDVGNRLKHQYLLTFLAKPPKKAGLQRVKIKTEVSNADLVSAEQVYVGAPK